MKALSFYPYEKVGDYVKALRLAKENHESPVIINRLEQSILTLGYLRLLFDENYKPRATLIELLKIVGMKNPQEIEQINDWAQKNLLRKGERWEEQTDKFEKLNPKIEPLLIDLGFITGVSAHFTTYQGAIFHGDILLGVRAKLTCLAQQWKEGARFSTVYFLTGARPLDPKEENKEALLIGMGGIKIRDDWTPPLNFPLTEAEMMEFVWEQSQLPEDMSKHVKVHCINAPMKNDSKTGMLIRPTTNDTIDLWLKNMPPLGRYLVISAAPYLVRQDAVMRSLAPKGFEFDTIGFSAHPHESTAIILDEVARLIFQTNQLVKIKNKPK